MGRLRVALLLFLGAVAVAAAPTAAETNSPSPPAPPRVVGFWLVDVATRVWRRRLTDGVTIREPPGTYTIAALSSAGRRLPVVFVKPVSYARTERVAPFVAAGKRAGAVRGMALPTGAATVSAYVASGAGGARPPLTTVQMVIEGPTPTPSPTASPTPTPAVPPSSDVQCGSPWPTPAPTLAPAVTAPPVRGEDDLALPPGRPGCPPPTNVNVYGGVSRGGPEPWYFWVSANALCAGAPVRVQVFATADDGVSSPWRVSQFLFTPPSAGGFAVTPRPRSYLEATWEARRRCGSPAVFATLCVAGKDGWCVRSVDERMLAAAPPVVAYVTRPPWVLALAPGDVGATVRATVGNTIGLVMVGVAQAPDGTLCRSRPTTSRELRVDLGGLTGGRGGGVPASANGSVVWMEYSAPGCTRTVGSTAAVANTTLLVSADVDPLVVQDTRPPSDVVATYPPTQRGRPVQLTVKFVNSGGGSGGSGRLGSCGLSLPTTSGWR
eukprot:TRINITY_DN2023_c0_g1_i12.p1 TRINITY_DN2023_c0_g1~~TRINITY_DN2023_c0_g1_i12.p1  ORF type:complete len:494 (-),score=107.71 TRINITY_DN2023_c0_g1_i12:443-1924(-)